MSVMCLVLMFINISVPVVSAGCLGVGLESGQGQREASVPGAAACPQPTPSPQLGSPVNGPFAFPAAAGQVGMMMQQQQ